MCQTIFRTRYQMNWLPMAWPAQQLLLQTAPRLCAALILTTQARRTESNTFVSSLPMISPSIPALNAHVCSSHPFYIFHSVAYLCSSVLTHSTILLTVCTQTSHHKPNRKRRLVRILWSHLHYQHQTFMHAHLLSSTPFTVSHTSSAI